MDSRKTWVRTPSCFRTPYVRLDPERGESVTTQARRSINGSHVSVTVTGPIDVTQCRPWLLDRLGVRMVSSSFDFRTPATTARRAMSDDFSVSQKFTDRFGKVQAQKLVVNGSWTVSVCTSSGPASKFCKYQLSFGLRSRKLSVLHKFPLCFTIFLGHGNRTEDEIAVQASFGWRPSRRNEYAKEFAPFRITI